MEYSVERVRALSEMARIALTNEEVEDMRRSLGALHALAEALEYAPVDETADDPFLNARPLDEWREDRAVSGAESRVWLTASESADGFFTVPRVVEE
ncbi:MAG: hypothetical protein IJW29_04520 [Clostridia bacterium]|nr:hypothetical protein [Clostridia bacterium]